MGTSNVTVFEYNGSILGLNGGGLVSTNLFNFGSGGKAATITDDNGILNAEDTRTSLFTLADGTVVDGPIEFIGAGTMSTIGLLGIEIDQRPVAAFSVNGQIYLIAPDGFPLLSGVSLSFNLDANADFALPAFIPCLAAGTLVLTSEGEKPIESIEIGDKIVDAFGQAHVVRWTGSESRTLTQLDHARAHPAIPILVPKNALGPGIPYQDTLMTRQHRIVIHDTKGERCFAKANWMLRHGCRIAEGLSDITYHHLLFDTHIVLVSNGMESESLLLAPGSRKALGEAKWASISEIFPEAAVPGFQWETCLPCVTKQELDVIMRGAEHPVETAPETIAA